MEDKIKEFLVNETKVDAQFSTKYDESKFDLCVKWLFDVVKAAYESLKGRKNGGIEISDEKCYMACKHFYNEELWKDMEKPVKTETKESTTEKKASAKQEAMDLFSLDDEEEMEDEE